MMKPRWAYKYFGIVDKMFFSAFLGLVIVGVVIMIIGCEIEFVRGVINSNPFQIETVNTTYDVRTDSIQEQIETLRHEQDHLANDLRQETNNIINKVNGWISFWIGLLTIFGAVIPCVLQYVLHRKSQRETEAIIEKAIGIVENTRLQLAVESIHISRDNQLLNDSGIRENLIGVEINEAWKGLSELFKKIEEKDTELSTPDEILMLNAMLQYYRLIDILTIMGSEQRSGTRIYATLKQSIKDLITHILNHSEYTRHQVWAEFLDLLPKLRNLPTPS